jgi:3-hydroxyisobutyrate dehydrogenase
MADAIAVLGTGTMGAPMARNLADAGFHVRVWNRSRAKAEPLADQCAVHEDAAGAVAGARFVLTMLADGDAVRSVMTGGALAAMDDGAVWLQVSTVGVAAEAVLRELAADRGVGYVDAPVSGTKEPAEQGKLVVLASGDESLREDAERVFAPLAARVVWLGEAGKGSAMKLVVNTWLLALVEGLAESIALADALGVDPAGLIEVLDGGPLFAPYAKLKGQAMIDGEFPPSFALSLAAKDARLVAAAAEDAGLDLPLPRTIAGQMERGVDAGHGDEDMSATVRIARGA